jgi:hypothetical protein
LLEHYPEENELYFRFARNAYLKTRNAEGDRAFSYVKSSEIKKAILKTVYKGRAVVRNLFKKVYLVIKP